MECYKHAQFFEIKLQILRTLQRTDLTLMMTTKCHYPCGLKLKIRPDPSRIWVDYIDIESGVANVRKTQG